MSTLQIELPPKLHDVFTGDADVRGAKGGRGSGKTRSFATMSAVRGAIADEAKQEGSILCMRQIMSSLDDSSMAEVKAAIRANEWLSDIYEYGEKYIRTRSRRVSYDFAGLYNNLGSIKSKAKILLGWVDEAEPVSETAWQTLMPTIREEGSELWVTWNPEVEDSATDKRFWKDRTDRMKIVEMNWNDNPFFPEKLNRDRLEDKLKRPYSYAHVWEGAYATAFEGAYYADALNDAKAQRRIGRVSADPLMSIKSYHDIGGDGRTSDDYVIWVVQFIDKEIRVLDHYKSQGQSLGHHVQWMRDHGWSRAEINLPHDGVRSDGITGKPYSQHWRDAGFVSVRVLENAGRGAYKQRIEAGWRLFPRMWFNEESTKVGRKMLGLYRENINKDGVRLGAMHNSYSHDADAFGLMCLDYREPMSVSELKVKMPVQGNA